MIESKKLKKNLYISQKEFAEMTSSSPISIHLNPSGLIRLGDSIGNRFSRFNQFINTIKDLGGNIAIPSYSYSFVGKKETFDMKNTPSYLGNISEFLRNSNPEIRSCDPNFSYLMYGVFFDSRHQKVHEYETFGLGSLIDDIFKANGYLCAIGGVLEHLTELHYIENILGVGYRFNKIFFGKTIDLNGLEHSQSVKYFCRDLKSDYIPSFLKFKNDIRSSNLLNNIYVKEYNMRLEVIRFKDCYEFLKEKLSYNPKYCWGKNN